MRAKSNLKFRQRKDIANAIKQESLKKIRQVYGNVRASIAETVQGLVRRQLLASNVTQSLLSGKLKKDFGLTQTSASKAIQEIITYISNNSKIMLNPSTKANTIAVFTLDLMPAGINGLKAIPAGSYSSAGKFGGGEVSWLTWLLERGTTVVIGDFWVFDSPKGTTRGGAVMQKVSKQHPDGFRVDPNFAGTKDNNFITRALEPIIPQIRDSVFAKIQEGFK